MVPPLAFYKCPGKNQSVIDRMNELLDILCSCKISNIQITSSEPVLFLTQYISPTEFYLVTYIDHSLINTADISDAYNVCISDTNSQTFVYKINRNNSPINIYKLKWASDCQLIYTFNISCIQQHPNTPSHLFFISLPDVLHRRDFLEFVMNESKNATLIFLDDLACKMIAKGEYTHEQIANQLHGKWIIQRDRDACIEEACTLFPSKMEDLLLSENDCLMYDSTCLIKRDMYNLTPNSWDAVVVSTTNAEMIDGRLEAFLHHLIATIDTTATIEKNLYIIFNKTSKYTISPDIVYELNAKFRKVEFVDLDIQHDLDIYIKNPKSMSRPFPKYGNASGPNLAFLRTMRALRHHNTILQLETDCKLKKGWVESCDKYVQHSGRFLIAGGLYDGKLIGDTRLNNHINGVAFYKTGSALFQKLLDFLEIFIMRNAICGRIDSSYDYVCRICVDCYLQYYTHVPEFYCFWRYIHRMIVHTSNIVNLSTAEDRDIDIEYINNLYDAVIIHQK